SVALVGIAVALSVGPLLLRRPEETAVAPSTADEPPPRIPWAPIVLVGLAVMFMYISDSATSNWSAVYLRDALHGSRSIAPLALVIVALAPSFAVARRIQPVEPSTTDPAAATRDIAAR